jgi:hypothetical protein
MKTRLVTGGIVVATTVIVAAAAAAGGSASSARLRAYGFTAERPAGPPIQHLTRQRTKVYHLTTTSISTIDNDPAGTSQGDEVVVEGRLLHRHAGAGRLEVVEVLTGLGTNGGVRVQITLTALLTEGQITAIAGTTFNRSTTSVRAGIVGGTGKYRNARGQVTIQPGSGNSTRLTYHLLP